MPVHELHAIRHGDGLPVRFVLVHGLASNARMWDGVCLALAELGHGSIAVDLRGHGGSPKPDDGYDFDSVVGDLLPLLENRPVVAGQSYGGNVVVHLAATHPELVTGIACVDGGAIELARTFPALDDCIAALRPPYERFVGTPAADYERFLRASHADWPETGIQGALACHDVDDEGRIQVFLTWERHRQIIQAMWHQRVSTLWPTIEVPVLFVMASERMRPGVDEALAALRDGRSTWFEGAHHDVHAQKPVEVASLLAGMLPS
ncbi:MAG: esterase [Actinomycetota bacterium]|nr:esterase [Actinomycetota bacterium]